MNNRSMLISALVGALVMIVLSNVPVLSLINCLLCAGICIGGMVAVWFYRRQTGTALTTGQAAAVGAVAGVIAGIVGAILAATLGADAIQTAIESDPTGQVRSALGGLVGGAGSFLVSFVINIIVYPLFGAIGGMIYAALTNRPTSKMP